MAVPVRTDIFVVVGRNPASIILYLDQVETVVLETNLCDREKILVSYHFIERLDDLSDFISYPQMLHLHLGCSQQAP